MKLHDWQQSERPREKLLSQGAANLSDAELLAIFLRTGIQGVNVVELANQLLSHFGSLRALFSAKQQAFCQVKGLGEAKYVQLQAVLELSRRYFAEQLKRPNSFNKVSDTERYLVAQLRDHPHEVFAMLCLDSQHRLIHFRKMFHGTIDAASVYPRTLVKQALEDNAAAVILAHNHPSGISEPSQADKLITDKISSAMALVDIRVLDHFVVGDDHAYSFAEHGLLT